MTYLLDTNVVSELRKRKPHEAVLSWIRDLPEGSLRLSVITLGEIQAGIELTREQDVQKATSLEAVDSLAGMSGLSLAVA